MGYEPKRRARESVAYAQRIKELQAVAQTPGRSALARAGVVGSILLAGLGLLMHACSVYIRAQPAALLAQAMASFLMVGGM